MEIYKLIPKVMEEIGAIGKGRKNVQQNYQFRGIDDIYNAVNAALAKHEVFCVPKVISNRREERQTKAGGMLIYTILEVEYTFYAPDGSNIVAVMIGEAMDSGDKSCNKAMSAAQKYAFLQIFCIPTEEPKDTENETHEVLPNKEQINQSEPQKKSEGTNYKFLQTMKAIKAEKGDEPYYKILGAHGFEHSKDIQVRETQLKVYNDMNQFKALLKDVGYDVKSEEVT